MVSPPRIINDTELWRMANTPNKNGETPLQYFERNITLLGDFNCWVWTARLNKYGYGRMLVDQQGWFTHRFSYELHLGSAQGLQLDHLCRKRDCCNPWHLEPVTPHVNKARALGFHVSHWKGDTVLKPQKPRTGPKNCVHGDKPPSKCPPCRKAAKKARREGQKKYWERIRAERDTRCEEVAADAPAPVPAGTEGKGV
jgi:hypothetical protein